MEYNKTKFQGEFERIIRDFGEGNTIVMGAITKDMRSPQAGVSGASFEALVIIASLIRNIARAVDETEEGVLGVIYEMLQDVRESDKSEEKKS